jgi:hypothetical protein
VYLVAVSTSMRPGLTTALRTKQRRTGMGYFSPFRLMRGPLGTRPVKLCIPVTGSAILVRSTTTYEHDTCMNCAVAFSLSVSSCIIIFGNFPDFCLNHTVIKINQKLFQKLSTWKDHVIIPGLPLLKTNFAMVNSTPTECLIRPQKYNALFLFVKNCSDLL